MKKIWFWGCVLFIISCSATQKQIEQRYITTDDIVYRSAQPQSRAMLNIPCSSNEAYTPDTNYLELTPVKYINVNVHWMNAADSSKNYIGQKAIDFAKGLIHSCNADMRNNYKLWLPYGNDLPVIPPRLQYRFATKQTGPDDDGIYFHFDDELYYYIHKGRTRNLFDRRVFKKYSVNPDSVLNIFIMPHHPDSVRSSTYNAYGVGVALGKAIKVSGLYEDGGPPWRFKGLLNHEVGHIFTLVHAWVRNDGCDDTPPHPGRCWNRSEEPPCDTMATNNMMDYNALQNALTPCQIGRMHKAISNLNGKKRALITPTWCSLTTDQPILIKDSLALNGARDLEQHVIIDQDATLVINCRVSLPPNATITVRPGGHLVLNENALLHNACGKQWNGIIIQEDKNRKGLVTIIGNARIEDHKFKLDQELEK